MAAREASEPEPPLVLGEERLDPAIASSSGSSDVPGSGELRESTFEPLPLRLPVADVALGRLLHPTPGRPALGEAGPARVAVGPPTAKPRRGATYGSGPRTNASAPRFVSSRTRLEANEEKAAKRPSAEILASKLRPFA